MRRERRRRIGAGIGIGRIGSSAVEGIARQPEATGNIQTSAIILAALIEGATLFSLSLQSIHSNPALSKS